ncbi:S8 family serine peptidase [Bacillus sp. FJAT-27445]|uniref:S8 family serine peptidase n=1 Tax=Bacillus sp. FJAT-27445 TaxID=1679166 RepID=UPI00074359EC|nr:S8 family serine peptidase [Bacillus sp. FJAT-27445]
MKVFKILLIVLLCFSIFAVDGFLAANEEKKEKEKNKEDSRNYLIVLKDDVEKEAFINSKKIKEKKLKDKNPKKFKHTNAFAVELTEAEAKEFANDKEVKILEEDSTVAITSGQAEEEQHIPWGISTIGSTEGFKQDFYGNGIKVAIFDTGISEHKDLHIAGGVSFVKDTANFADDNGHGTHVAGTLSAQNNEFGVVGTAPGAEIYSIKVLNNSGEGSYSQVIQGIEWAIDQQMNIISMSFGGMTPSLALHEAIKKANEKGILLVASAGNFGMGEETEAYPARFPEVLSVGAIDNTKQRASFSSTGSELDLVAPGVNIFSTTYDGEYGYNSGTSMAAPHVAGAAAVIWSKEEDLTNEEVKKILLESATPLGQKNEYGNGLVNVAKALGLDSNSEPMEPGTPIDINLTTELRKYESRLSRMVMILYILKDKAIELQMSELSKQIDDDANYLVIENQELLRNLEKINESGQIEVNKESIEFTIESYFVENQEAFLKLEDYYQEKIKQYLQVLQLSLEEINENLRPLSGAVLEIGKPLDISLSPGNSQVYTFTPSVTQTYKIYTSPYGETGSYNNTYLEIFSDSGLNKLVDFNDDYYQGSNFSEIVVSLNEGTTYYVKLRHSSSSGSVFARLNVSSFVLNDTIMLNTPLDVDILRGDFNVYTFTASKDGNYEFSTTYYKGDSKEGFSSNLLTLYSDYSNTRGIAHGWSFLNYFARVNVNLGKGDTIFIKLESGNLKNVHTRLTVSESLLYHTELSINTPLNVNIGESQFQSFSFTPSVSGAYRIFTGPIDGIGNPSDTYLYMYEDTSLIKLLALNDDSNATRYSSIEYHLNAGQTYYFILKGYSRQAVSSQSTINKGSQYEYDAAGRLDYILLVDGKKLDYQYDPNGNLVKKVIVSK